MYSNKLVVEIGDLYPLAIWEKIGPLTWTTGGEVNSIVLQHCDCWVGIYKIAITGHVGTTFTKWEDSEGCIFGYEDGKYNPAGLLIGKVQESNITIATPWR